MSPRITTALLALAILLGGVLLYARALDRVPPYLIHDEVQGALHAQAIASTGRGLDGRWLPMYFAEPGFAAGRDPIMIYVTAIGLQALPFTDAGVRTPTALVAVLNLLLMFFAARAIFGSTWAGLLAAVLLALTPIHFIRGRLLLSPLYSLPFMLAWLWTLRRFEEQPSTRRFITACVWLVVAMYSYLGAVVMVPLYLLMTMGVAAKSLRFRAAVLAAAVCLVCLLPMAAWYLANPDRNAQIVGAYQLAGARSISDVISDRIGLYWQFFDPSYLFISGDASLVNSTRTSGLFPWAFAALLPVGLIAMIRSRQPIAWVIAAGFLTAPLAAVISGGIEMNRVMFVIPFAVLTATGGAVSLAGRGALSRGIAVALVALVAVQFAAFHRHYMSDAYRAGAATWFSGNAREALRELIARAGSGPIYISDEIEWVQGLWRFYAIEANRLELLDRTIFFTDPPAIAAAGSMLICAADSPHCAATIASGAWRDVVRIPALGGHRTFVILQRGGTNDNSN